MTGFFAVSKHSGVIKNIVADILEGDIAIKGIILIEEDNHNIEALKQLAKKITNEQSDVSLLITSHDNCGFGNVSLEEPATDTFISESIKNHSIFDGELKGMYADPADISDSTELQRKIKEIQDSYS